MGYRIRSAVSIQVNDDEGKVDEPRRQINVTVSSLRQSPSRLHAPPSNDPGLDPSQQYIYVDGQDQGYIYYDAQDEAEYEQPVQQAYAMERPIRGSTEQASGTIPAAQLPSNSARQEHPLPEVSQPLCAAQTMPDSSVSLACPGPITPGAGSLSGCMLSRDSSAAFTSAVADLVAQQREAYPDSKNASTQEINVGDVSRSVSNAVDVRYLQSEPDIAISSVMSPPAPIEQPDPVSSHTQFEAAAKAEEMDDSRIQAGQHVSNAVIAAPFSSSSGADTNLTTQRPASEIVTQPAPDAEATTVSSATDALPQPVLEEKASQPLSMHYASRAPPTGSTSTEPRDEHESTGVGIDSTNDGVQSSAPAAPSVDLADSVVSKDSVELLDTSQTALQPSHPPGQMSPVPPPAPTARFDDKTSDTRAESSLIASVDSIGLSPLTSLDLSGSFFRDGEAKTPLPPSPSISPDNTSVVKSVSLEAAPHLIHDSDFESELPRPRQVAGASDVLVGCPPTSNTFERRSEADSDPDNAETRTHNDPVAKQEAPRESTQQDAVAQERHDVPADTPTGVALQHVPAVADRPDPQRVKDIGVRVGSAENNFQSSVEATTPVIKDLAPATVIESSTTATTASSNEVRRNNSSVEIA